MELCARPRAEHPYVDYPMSSSQEPCEVGPDGQGRRRAQRIEVHRTEFTWPSSKALLCSYPFSCEIASLNGAKFSEGKD